MRTVTAYDLGAFAAQATTCQNTAHGLGAHVVNVKTAADYERVRSGSGRFPGVMPDEPAPAGVPVQQARAPVQRAGSSELARKQINNSVIDKPISTENLALLRQREAELRHQPTLDKEYAASGYSKFRLKPVGEYGVGTGGAKFPLEYQIVATGPNGQEQLINTIKSTNPRMQPDLNPSNINKMVQQGAQRLGMKAGPKPPAPRPQAQPKPDIIQEHLNRWKDSYKSPTGAPNPNIPPPVSQPAPVPAQAAPARPAPAPVAPSAPAPATPPPAPAQPYQIGPTAPITMDNALGGPNGGQPSPPEPEPEAGPNGPNAGNYVPPAAPEPAPVSGLQPPEMLPKLNDQTVLAQRMNFENSRRQEEYDQALKQQQDVGNNSADYPTQAPAPEPDAGPNGPNAGNYVPPAAPEAEPVSALQPPEMLPKLNDQTVLAQRMNFENSRRQEEYDQTLKQRQDVGNNPADYPTQAPAAAPASTPDSILPPPASAQKQYAYSPQDAEMVAKDEAAHQAMLQNPAQSAVETGTLMSNKSTARGAPNVSLAGDRIIPQTLNSTSDKINAPLSLGQRFAGPAAYASPAAQYHAENLNSNILRTRTGAAAAKAQAYSMPDMRTADAARQAQRDAEQAGPNGPNAEAYQPPPAAPTPSTQPTYGQKGLTRQELATQRSVGNVGKFAPSATRQAKPVQAPAPAAAAPKAPVKPVAAPAPAAAPKAPAVPVTPPAPPVPTPPPPKPTPPPVAPPPPVAEPTPPPPVAQRYAAPAPAYQPPAARPVLGGGLFGRRRR